MFIPGLPAGVGLGWRQELAASLFAAKQSADFIEIVAEAYFQNGPAQREILALAETWQNRVIPHGIRLSLGSAAGIDRERARRLGKLARQVRAPAISEHVAFTRAHRTSGEIGHLTQLPLTRTAVAVVARNLAEARRHLPDVPFLLETPAWTLRWPEDEMDEGTFFHELVRATSCDLLLDLGNVYANAQNGGLDPLTLLHRYPLERTAMVHLGGGAFRDGFYVDTHAHPIAPEVFALLAELVRVAGPVPVLIERDANFPPFAELLGEIQKTRRLLDAAEPARPRTPRRPRTIIAGAKEAKDAPSFALELAIKALADRQAYLAALLRTADPPRVTAPFDPVAIGHSRSILSHKRRDEARARHAELGPQKPRRRESRSDAGRLYDRLRNWANNLFTRWRTA